MSSEHGATSSETHDQMAHGEHEAMDHAHMEHGDHEAMDHAHMAHSDHEAMDHAHMAHGAMSGHAMHHGNFKRKFWVSLVAAIPVFVLSPFMGLSLPFQFTFPGSDWLVLVLATFLFGYGGQPFLSGARDELKAKVPAMMTLIAMGISVAYAYSLYAFVMNHFVAPHAHVMDFFWELASLIVIMLLGHWIEMNAVMNAGNVLEKMAALLPGEAHVQQADGSVQDVPLAELAAGATVVIRAGEKVPADGRVLSGTSAVNEALVTGEAKAVTKTTDATVIGGSVNGDGTLVVRVTGTGESGYLAQVAKLVASAQQEKSKAEGLADRVSRALFYAALAVGLVAFVVWWLIADTATALQRLVTVLVIACPHALGLAIPLVVARSTSLAASHGLLVRDRQALEAAGTIDTVLMDKTGTLTQGVFAVNAIQHTAAADEDTVLALAAALEAGSSHPLAAGIRSAAEAAKLTVPTASAIQTLQGVGVRGDIDGTTVALVTARYLDEHDVAYDQTGYQQLAAAGNSVSFLLRDQQVLGAIAQGDAIRPEAPALIQALRALGITPVMLTGDNTPAAQAIAHQLGDIEVRAELRPEDKAAIVAETQAAGHHAMMVGDGINDAPALARATIGMAIGAGTDVAIDAADVVLVKSDPQDILAFLRLGRATTRKMVQNLWWGAGYNLLALPLAAGVLAGIGVILSPAVGAVLMSASTVIVAINAMGLKLK
ncbi:copper-translocating P-type ATPase [Lacticaseibacillus absianus]|uniref:copper-translocating P-type ATPase n=1 Tax=Lacticaseibacillus absianus TaxID=2729623 RepID=UPI0015C6A127|nr:copper-translocating P-type ATPase [Lacticaseibacillus absianus]